jgi:hypothetical protein
MKCLSRFGGSSLQVCDSCINILGGVYSNVCQCCLDCSVEWN